MAQRRPRGSHGVLARPAGPPADWFSLAQFGPAWLSLFCPPSRRPLQAPALICPGLAQLGSAWLSLAQRPSHGSPGAQARLVAPVAFWFILVQLGSAVLSRLGPRAHYVGRDSASTHPDLAQIGSAWFSLAQRPPRGPPGRAGAPGGSCGRLAQLGSVWCSAAQPAQPARAACRQPLRARVWLSLAQLRSAWLSARHVEPRKRRRGMTVPAAAWFSLAQPGSAWLSRPGQCAQHFGRTSALVWLNLVQLGSAWLSTRRAIPSACASAPGRRCGSLAQLGPAWLSLAQLGSACPACARL